MTVRKALVVIVWAAKPGTDKKVLVLRLNPDRGGYWQSVTGKVEEGESYSDGALREAEEETGLGFERQPQYLGLEQEFEGRWGPAVERAFFLPIFGGKAPPRPTLDGKEHESYEWLDPEEAAARVKWPANKAAIERATTGASPLFLSRRGTFYQDGEEVTHARTVALLHKSLVKVGRNGWAVKVGNEELDVVLEHTPRFVLSYDREGGVMKLSDGTEEELDPESVLVHGEHGLTCKLECGWESAFSSPAYYEIAKDIEESAAGEYVLHFRGRSYRLGVAS